MTQTNPPAPCRVIVGTIQEQATEFLLTCVERAFRICVATEVEIGLNAQQSHSSHTAAGFRHALNFELLQ